MISSNFIFNSPNWESTFHSNFLRLGSPSQQPNFQHHSYLMPRPYICTSRVTQNFLSLFIWFDYTGCWALFRSSKYFMLFFFLLCMLALHNIPRHYYLPFHSIPVNVKYSLQSIVFRIPSLPYMCTVLSLSGTSTKLCIFDIKCQDFSFSMFIPHSMFHVPRPHLWSFYK